VSFQSAVFDARRISEVNIGISVFSHSIEELHEDFIHHAEHFHEL